jgi:hypothetical protein
MNSASLERLENYAAGLIKHGWIAYGERLSAEDLGHDLRSILAEREELRAALRYVIDVREIKCAHKHPAPDDFCARCRADAALRTDETRDRREVGR